MLPAHAGRRNSERGTRLRRSAPLVTLLLLTTQTQAIPETRSPARVLLILLLLTVAAFLISGYHPWAEDGEIYLPGIEKILNPQLFPVGTEYFQSHAHLTLFPNLIAASVKITHLPLDVVLLVFQIAAIFLLLLACWQLASLCFPSSAGRWC